MSDHDASLEDDPVPLPIRFGIIRATAIKAAAGYEGTITATTVRWQVTHPPIKEPQYIFRVPADGVFVRVGINTETVTTTPISQEA